MKKTEIEKIKEYVSELKKNRAEIINAVDELLLLQRDLVKLGDRVDKVGEFLCKCTDFEEGKEYIEHLLEEALEWNEHQSNV